jgi:hypothetical protein
VATFRPKVAPGEVPHVDMQAMVADFAHRAAGWRVSPARTMLIPAWLKDPRRHSPSCPGPAHGVLQRHHALAGAGGYLGDRSSWPGLVSRRRVGRCDLHQSAVLAAWLPAHVHHRADCPGSGRSPCRRAARHPGAGPGLGDRTGHGAVAPVAAVPACHHRPRRRLFRGTDLCRSICVGAGLERPGGACAIWSSWGGCWACRMRACCC